jgi:hypothetical protein
VEQSRAYRARFGAGVIVLLLGAVVLSPQNPASAAEAKKGDIIVSAPGAAAAGSAAAEPSGTDPVVMRGTRPAVPKPSPIAKGEPAAAGRNEAFQRSLPSGSGWNNELNWEGIKSENQADTVTR